MIGPYKLEHILGRGGTSVVWRATHTLSGEDVAIKVLTSERAKSARYREYFANEVRAVARLNHVHIAQVVDAGVLTESDATRDLFAGNPYVVTEFLAGGTLEDYRRRLQWKAVRDVLRAVLDALAHAHAHGVLHLDIKPGNLLLAGLQQPLVPVLTDFGIARVSESEQFRDEQRVTGTPRYMAPEQITGDWADQGPWTDLYGLGCLAYRLICGRVPFDYERATEILRAHVREPLPEFEPIIAVPKGIKSWLHMLLSKDPAHRPRSAAEAAWSLLESEVRSGDEWLEPTEDAWEENAEETIIEATVITPAMSPNDTSPHSHLLPGSRPPIPQNWRVHERRFGRPRPGYVGLGMARHRIPPFVGREHERDALWAALWKASQSVPHAVVIEGPTGIGKSRLVDWCARLVDELGIGVPLVARFRHPHAGLGPVEEALARYARVLHLKPEKALSRLRNFMAQLRSVDEGDLLDAVAFCDALRNGPTGPTRNERLGIATRLITRIAEHTPMVLVLDDADQESDAMRLVERLLASHGRILCLITSNGSPITVATSESMSRWQLSGHAEVLNLQKLPNPELAQVITHVARIEPHLMKMLLERSHGSPAESLQQLMSWLDREMLVPGIDGYELVTSRDSVESESMRELAHATANALLSRLDSTAQEAAIFAAVLGREIKRKEWESVLREAILPGPDRLIEDVVQSGLVFRDPNGAYLFVDENVRVAVLDALSDEARKSAEAIVADTLESLYALTDAMFMERLAGHRNLAGDLLAAAELLTLSAMRYLLTEQIEEAQRALTFFEELRQSHPEVAFTVASRNAEVATLWLLHETQELDINLLAVTQRACENDGAFRAAGSVARLRAKVLRKKSFEAANEAIEEAIGMLERAGEFLEAGSLMLSQGWNFGLQGEYDRAFQTLNRAQAIFRHEGDLHWVGKVDQAAAFLYLQRGDEVTARQRIDALFHIARTLGVRSLLSSGHAYLGEFERTRGNAEAALAHYSDVVTLLGPDSLNGKIAMLNQSLCRLALGRYREALLVMESVKSDPQIRAVGLQCHVDLARLSAEFGLGEIKEDWTQRWDATVRELKHYNRHEYDLAWLLEHVGKAFARQQMIRQRDEAFGLSEQIWRGLGREHDAERVRHLQSRV